MAFGSNVSVHSVSVRGVRVTDSYPDGNALPTCCYTRQMMTGKVEPYLEKP